MRNYITLCLRQHPRWTCRPNIVMYLFSDRLLLTCGSGDRRWLMLNNVVQGFSLPSSPSLHILPRKPSGVSASASSFPIVSVQVESSSHHPAVSETWEELMPCVMNTTGQWPVKSCLWNTLSGGTQYVDIVPGFIGSGDPTWKVAYVASLLLYCMAPKKACRNCPRLSVVFVMIGWLGLMQDLCMHKF